MKGLMLLAGLALTAAACGRATDPVYDDGEFHIVEADDTVELRYGATTQLASSGATLTFRAVVGDSRCPVDVTCVWAGDAHVRLDARDADGTREIDLHTGVEPMEAEFAGYRIRLVGVSPQRADGDDIRPHDYSVRLAISRG